jgi:hypothetical protein
MKANRNVLISFVLLVIIAAVYRAIPGRPWGFAPQIAMAIFGGSFIKDKKLSFALPILSMLISDIFYQILYINGIGEIQGFYEGQITVYILFAALTVIGFFIKPEKPVQILGGSIIAPVIYFLTSNFMVWIEGAGLKRPKTFDGLMMCYNDALPFLKGSLYGTLFFSLILFGGAYLLKHYFVAQTAREKVS